jgi:hypothetical protein
VTWRLWRLWRVRWTRHRRYWLRAPNPRTLSGMTTVYAYGTAHAVVMVGSYGAEGLKPRQIGPAHATIGRVNGQSRKALCGAYVTIDEQLHWPPEGYEEDQLCASCAELAAL